MRTIINNIDRTKITYPSDKEYSSAVGYLSTWSEARFPTVELYNDGDNDLVAIYYDSDGNRKYVIGAVWHGSEYGFHS